VLIRHADPARDAAGCASVYGPYVSETAISFEDEPPGADEFARRISAISERFPWLVADENGVVVGYAYASAHHDRAAYRWAADVAVYVDRAIHHRGVTLPNDASVALHEACGFQFVGVYKRIGWKMGRWHDVGWWELELQPPSAGQPPEPSAPARL
jgi:phosphinothricin acetyltransferase